MGGRKCSACPGKPCWKSPIPLVYLEKYFDDAEAFENFPHLALNAAAKSEAVAAREIGLLDVELSRSEARAANALRGAQVELQNVRLSLARESRDANRRRLAALQKLQQKGFLQSIRTAPQHLARRAGEREDRSCSSQERARPKSALQVRSPQVALHCPAGPNPRPKSAVPARSNASALRPSSGVSASTVCSVVQSAVGSPSRFLVRPRKEVDETPEHDLGQLSPDWSGWCFTAPNADAILKFAVPGVSPRPTSAKNDGRCHYLRRPRSRASDGETVDSDAANAEVAAVGHSAAK